MGMNRIVRQWKILASLPIDTFSILRLRGIISVPVALCSRRVAGAAIRTLPSLRVHVLPTAEEGSEQRDLLRSAKRAPVRSRFSEALRLLRNGFSGNAVISDQTPESFIFMLKIKTLLMERIDFG